MEQSGDRPPSPGQCSDRDGSAGIILAGAARPIPGRTKVEGARIVMSALQRAREGQQVLHPLGQQSEWLHRRFLASQLDIGLATWKYFKQAYADVVELDDSQQWVRLRSSAAG